MDGLNPTPTVEVLYAAGAEVAEGPFYEEETNTLLWVDIHKQTINFLNLQTNQNRYIATASNLVKMLPTLSCFVGLWASQKL